MKKSENPRANLNLMKLLFKPHPWHGIDSGDDAPQTEAFPQVKVC
jgi:hypothetical protein